MFDFLIIGAGIAGASAAAELAPHGSTLIVEAEDAPGYHATGRSAAMFLENYGNAVVCALNSASAPSHHDMGILSKRAFLLLGTEGQDSAFAAEAEGFDAKEISIPEAQRLLPILNPETATRAALYSDAFDLDTDLMLQTYLRRAKAAGAQLVTKARITAITRKQGLWHVTAGDQTWQAAKIINAAGAWADTVAQIAGIAPLGIQPLRRSMARLAAPGGHDVSNWPFVDALGESWYAKPDAGGLIVSPSEEEPMPPQDAWADDMVIAEALYRYSAYVTEEPTRPLATWAGLRSFAPDRALVIGPDGAEPDFIWCAGQGGYGFQTAPAAARLTADLTLARAPLLGPETVAALNPARFSGAATSEG
ncbi:FAD-binding oxidoreductase [Alphaproteobacteria bacterium KMM 3653]|uniref:FAD-binding oxidoreductase n=1 Tax=Harenicola maris TaxID=2841044 RepID=A0AAP2CTD6_9RHOB|nr:FAD-binding oxidoreductase [Harenicola maris]